MKVAFSLYFTNSFGGAERRFTRIYNKIGKTGCDVTFLIRGCNNETARKVFKGADCDVSQIKQIVCFDNTYSLLRYVIKEKFEVVHFFDTSRFNLILNSVCKAGGLGTIFSICNYFDALNLSTPKEMKIVKKLVRKSDCVDLLYPSAKAFIDSFSHKKKVSITPGTFTDLAKFNVGQKNYSMIFSGRLDEQKNPLLLIEAIKLCSEDIRKQKYKILIIGKGQLESKVKDKIIDYEIEDVVEMLGYVKTSDYLPNANVFFSLQKVENYPSQSLAEAAACGCYSIITDVGDSRKCANESFALFIEDDPQQLADAILEYLLKDESEKISIISNARAFAEKNYTIDNSVIYFNKLLNNVKNELCVNRMRKNFSQLY